MVRVFKPKEISVRVPVISGRQKGELYLNRNIRVIEIWVPENFGSGFWLPNNPFLLQSFPPYFV